MEPIPPLLLTATCARDEPASAVLVLPFEVRSRSRFRAALPSGQAVLADLPRGTVLRGGDKVRATAGAVVHVLAANEVLIEAQGDAAALARAAYHLGNRHVPVEVGAGWLRLREDHVLASMLEGLGVRVHAVHAPFEPEAGAYAPGHSHGLPASARIHDFGHA